MHHRVASSLLQHKTSTIRLISQQSNRCIGTLRTIQTEGDKPRIEYYAYAERGTRTPENAALRTLVLRELKQRAEQKPQSDYGKQILKYIAKISKYQEKKNAERVLQTLEDMRLRGVAPDHQVYHAAINAVARAERFDLVHQLAQEMKQEAKFFWSDNLLIYLINACKFTADAQLAQTYFDEYMARISQAEGAAATTPAIQAFNNLINVYAAAGDEAGMLRVVEQMDALGLARDSFTYASLIKLYSKEQRLDAALALVDEMRQKDIEVTRMIYSMLIKACRVPEQLQTAIDLFEEMTVRDAQNYEDLITKLREVGDVQRAYEYFERMKKGPFRPSQALHRIMLEICELDNNNIAKARRVFAEMQTRYHWTQPEADVLEVRARIEQSWRDTIAAKKQQIAQIRAEEKERRQSLIKQAQQAQREKKEQKLLKKGDKKTLAKLKKQQKKQKKAAGDYFMEEEEEATFAEDDAVGDEEDGAESSSKKE